MGAYRLVGSKVIAEAGFLTLFEDRFTSPSDGELVRFVVRHPGAVVAVPLVDGPRVDGPRVDGPRVDGPRVDGDGDAGAPGGQAALCVRQFRAAVRQEVLELPAGKLDVPDEDPDDAIARELAEEIGHRPGRLVKLGEFWNSPGFCTERTHVYLALDLEPCEEPEPVKEEERHMTVERVPLADTARLVAQGRITDAKTIIGLLMAERWIAGAADGTGR